jgi:EmrB/QacA subfamily drug resistance transporter
MKSHRGRSPWSSLDHRQRHVFAATLPANALIFFDQTAIVVALPSIQRQFHTSAIAEQWVITAYLFTMAVFMPAAGRFADHFGRKRLFLVGVLVFGCSSAACAASPSLAVLIAARSLQGVGASILQPIALGNTTRAVGDDHRGWAIGVLSTGGTTFLALGPLIAGLILEVASWRWLFIINLPVVAFATIEAVRFITPSREPSPERINWVSLCLLLSGLASVVLGIAQLRSWAPWSLVLIPLGGVILAGFVVHELRNAAPLLDLYLLTDRMIRGALVALFAVQFVVTGVTVYLAIYLEHGLGISTLVTGVVIAIAGIFTPLLSITTGRIADQRGARRLVPAGLGLAAIGLLWIGVAATWERVALLVPGLLIFSLARPAVFTPASVTPLASLGPERRGVASSLVTEGRQLGSVLGVAILGTIFAAAAPTTELARHGHVANGFQLVTLTAAGVAALAAIWTQRLFSAPTSTSGQ